MKSSGKKVDFSKLSDEKKFMLLDKRIRLLKDKVQENEEISYKNFAKSNIALNESTEKLNEIESAIRDSKEAIASFTFQLITIIMGIFALILSIMFLWVNSDQIISDWIFFYQATIIFFIVLFSIFVYSWIAKNFCKQGKYAFITFIVFLMLFLIILFYENIITTII